MSHESRINDALRALGEEFRLGMIAAEEYRARRRRLLESWGERDVTTSPAAQKAAGAGPGTRPGPARVLATHYHAPGGSRRGWMLALGALVLVLASGAASWMLAPPAGPEEATRSAELRAVNASAADFLARNRWEAADLDAFAQQWTALPAEQRLLALDEPAIKSLRHQLAQNIRAESQALAVGGDETTRLRLERLMQFARQLSGEAL